MKLTKELKIIGKVANVEQEKRIIYLEGMLDLINLISEYDNVDENFICAMHNYLMENGQNTNMLYRFYDSYKNTDE